MASLSGSDPIRQAVRHMGPRIRMILASAILFAGAAWLAKDQPFRWGLVSASAILAFAVIWLLILTRVRARFDRGMAERARDMIGHDPAPCILTGLDGKILFRNDAAGSQLSDGRGTTLFAALKGMMANPGEILFRLEEQAQAHGAASEDIVTRRGHLRLSVHRAGSDGYLWRIERSANRPQRDNDPVPLPMLTVGRNGTVLFMNACARKLVGERARTLDRIFPELPLRSGRLNAVTTRDGVISCLIMELEGIAGRREVFILPGVSEIEHQADGWAFFDELPVPLMKLARTGEIELSNRPARDLLGVVDCRALALSEVTEGLGRSISGWLEEAAEGRGSGHPEFLRVKREDREVFVKIDLTRVVEDGRTVLIAALNDATELKSLEAQFVQSQKMQAIGQLAGGVAHDFNNLLTAISGHCDLLLLRHDPGDQDYADLEQINQNANRAATLVSQLLAYSRKQTMRLETMDLRDTLSDLTHLLNRLVGEKITLSLSHDPDLMMVRADKRQLEQVIMNLVVNARDAMPGGGDIRIRTQTMTLTEPLRRDRAVVAPGDYVSVTVADEGHGIPADKLEHVFDPFFTTKKTCEGTGLGLSTAYGIIKQTGGFIFADSTVGEGTCFWLLLPARENAGDLLPKPSIDAEGAPPLEGVILLVEDEAPVRAFASRALQLRGFSVLEAESAEDALDLLSDESLHVDVFVTDVIMPGRDGPSWVREALCDRPEVRVVFTSGYAKETFCDAQSEIGNSVFLPKPFSLSDLTDTVRKQLA